MKKLIVLFIFSLLFLQGCSTKVFTTHLVPEEVAFCQNETDKGLKKITVQSQIPSQLIMIDEKNFALTLQTTLALSGIFGNKVPKYQIDATLVELGSSGVSIEFPTELKVQYRIYAPTGELLGVKTITTNGRANGFEALLGSVRERLARERAIRSQLVRFVQYVIETVRANELRMKKDK
ncbi:hypothetical protein [Halodesulfovibrio sp. MK-HDV]|jgi:hypothetical protein|uniref:hypothetical protein n=1 Tax=Halodesulfovibrio sp. MK-HDV TaxID=2599925 RepID=UPI0013714C9C|nr:hypothetical protein [Halodesulfovibrio sp. MK-HDV]KAF1077645.1 hypothetical protein MKHDV_00101 [Halodesulfovibrio sp. MK-HDV]